MVRNKQINLIASVKILNIDVINKHTINYRIGGGGGLFSICQLPIISLKPLFISLPQLFFSMNCIQNRLLRVSFIALFDFII